ncbi:glycosyltransferase family 2 protein [Pseudothermotoga sp. U03pept]|uniref:glycosyltransferase family 2 protein n=1 Tax=Pseudothermotoga sp. U03pept TaxID=3447012 RepID=UPI003F01758C
MQPAISIVIPAYNVEDYIRSTLESVKRQTYKNIEVIVVNDGSKDNTSEVARQKLADAEFPWMVIDQENQGVSVARNVGLSKASGEYVLFLDGDDRISELYVEKMYKKAKELDCDIVFCKFSRISDQGNGIRTIEAYDDLYSPKVHTKFENGGSGLQVLGDALRLRVWVWTASAIYRRSFLINNCLLFSPKYWVAEDIDFEFKALFAAKAVASVSDTLAFYLERPGSVTQQKNRLWEKMLMVKEVFEGLAKFFDEAGADEKTKSLFENYSRIHLWGYVRQVYALNSIKDVNMFGEMFAYAKKFKPVSIFKWRVLFAERILLGLLPGELSLKCISFLISIKENMKLRKV